MSTQSIFVHSLVFFSEDVLNTALENEAAINLSGVTTYNTFDTWGLIPSSKPKIVLPPYKENFIELAGANGGIDATEVLGSVVYGYREDTVEFQIQDYPLDGQTRMTFEQLKRAIANALHGKRMAMYLESDPGVVYAGRWAIDDMHTEEYWSVVTLKYKIDPYGYLTSAGTAASRMTL